MPPVVPASLPASHSANSKVFLSLRENQAPTTNHQPPPSTCRHSPKFLFSDSRKLFPSLVGSLSCPCTILGSSSTRSNFPVNCRHFGAGAPVFPPNCGCGEESWWLSDIKTLAIPLHFSLHLSRTILLPFSHIRCSISGSINEPYSFYFNLPTSSSTSLPHHPQ